MNPFQHTKKLTSIFITAGFPRRESLPEQLMKLQTAGIDFIEIGIPFSDPLADGPIIQQSSEIALQNGMQMDLLFEQIRSIRNQIHVPLLLMGYFNPIHSYGFEKFLSSCKNLNISGLIVPDLSFEIIQHKYAALLEKYAIPMVHIITPNTDDNRIREIANVSNNAFVYLVGQNATTGRKISFTTKQERYLEIKRICDKTPVMIGFGVQNRQDIEEVCTHADGAIIGSAYIRAILEKRENTFLEELLAVKTDTN